GIRTGWEVVYLELWCGASGSRADCGGDSAVRAEIWIAVRAAIWIKAPGANAPGVFCAGFAGARAIVIDCGYFFWRIVASSWRLVYVCWTAWCRCVDGGGACRCRVGAG